MNLSAIVTPNVKGQIVIPQAMRKALDIGPKRALKISLTGRSLLVQPIKDVILADEAADKDLLFKKILERTRGAWADTEKDWDERRKKQRKIELAASRKRKSQTW